MLNIGRFIEIVDFDLNNSNVGSLTNKFNNA